MSDTQPESRSYRSDAISGGRWGAVRSVALQVAGILTTAVLARLLSDVDFGLVAITVIVLTMFDLITRVGFGASVIRNDNPTDTSNSTFFWASVILGLIAGALAALVSRPVAALAGSVEAAPLVALAAVTLPINLASRVPSGLLIREFRFRAGAAIEISGAIIHSTVAVSLAIAGFGAWAVVIGQVLRSVTLLAGFAIASGFRPKARIDRQILKQELSFNLGWLGSDLVGYANKNADYWFVGNRLGTAQLGVYYVAYVFPNLLRRRVTTIGHEILYPLVARIKDDKARITSAYLRVVRLISFLVVPAMLGLAVLADLAIRIGFGSEWVEAIVPLRVISVAAAVTAMTVVANAVFPAMGRPGILVRIGLVAFVALGLALAVSWEGGTLTLVSLAVLAAALVEAIVTLIYVRSFLGVGLVAFGLVVAPYAVSAIVMAGSLWGLRVLAIGELGVILQALVLVPTGTIIYLIVGRIFFRDQFKEQWSAVNALLGRGE